MSNSVTCPECGKSYDTPRGFLSHWGHADDEAHSGPAPKDAYGELEFSESHREGISEAKEGHTHDEETRQKIAEAFKGHDPWNKGLTKEDDERLQQLAESMTGTEMPDHVVELSRQRMKRMWEDGTMEQRDNVGMPGEENPAYRHGKFTGGHRANYPDEFNQQLRENVRERDNRTCQCCGATTEQKLDVHHIDGNKENNDMENLIALCRNCHGTIEWSTEPVQEMALSTGPSPDWGLTERVVM